MVNRKRCISTVRGSRGQSGGGTRQRGLTAKLHLAVDAHGMPVQMLATAGGVSPESADDSKFTAITNAVYDAAGVRGKR